MTFYVVFQKYVAKTVAETGYFFVLMALTMHQEPQRDTYNDFEACSFCGKCHFLTRETTQFQQQKKGERDNKYLL